LYSEPQNAIRRPCAGGLLLKRQLLQKVKYRVHLKKIFENTLPLQEKDLLYFGSDENIGIHRGTPERSRCSNLATEPGDSPRIPQNFSFPRFQRF